MMKIVILFKLLLVNKGIHNLPIGIMVRVITNSTGNRGSVLGKVIPKTKKVVFDISLTLSTIRYGSKVSGALQKKDYHPPSHFSVVAIEKELSDQPRLRLAN